MDKKKTFLHNEIWLLVFGGAFQRANIYKANINNKLRASFRIELKTFVEEHIIPQYKVSVCEMSHVQNLETIVTFSAKWKGILNNGKLLIGVSQKLLNLALKYYWCLGEINTPPHCPIDRIIQEKGLKSKNIVNWTSISDIDVYLKLVKEINQIAKGKGQTIAEWELEEFSRNNL